MYCKEPNNKGLVWVFLLRLAGEDDLGISVLEVVSKKRCTKRNLVSSVAPGGPAARAGIRVGEEVRAYTLALLKKERLLWKSDTLDILNAHGPEMLVGIQVRQLVKLTGIQQTRARMIAKLRVRYFFSSAIRLLLIFYFLLFFIVKEEQRTSWKGAARGMDDRRRCV